MSAFAGQFRRWMVQAVTERIGLKLIAFVITLLLITLVRFQEESERFFDVEVVPVMPEAVSGLIMTSGFPKTVRVRLSGPNSVINALSPADIPPIEVDLRARRAGTSHYYFNADLIEESLKARSKKMQFVRVLRTSPESIQIKMENLVSREVPVKINLEGRTAPGTTLSEVPTADPETATLIGPASAMRGVKSVETDGVLVDGLGVGTHVRTVSATPVDGVSIRGADSLKITVKVRWITGERTLKQLPISLQSEDVNAEFKPKTVDVKISGPKIKLDALEPGQVKPVVAVNLEQIVVPGVVEADVTVSWLPDGLTVSSIDPPSVRVSLSHVSAASKTRRKKAGEKGDVNEK